MNRTPSFRQRIHTAGRRLGLLVLLAVAALPASAQPAMSRGEQRLPISYDECMRRATRALQAEGFTLIGQGGAFVHGFKNIHGAYILCNVAPEGTTWANVVVASSHNDSGVPGGERQRLQGRMNEAGTTPIPPSGGPYAGRWLLQAIIPPGQPYAGTYAITVALTDQGGVLSGSGTWSNGKRSTFSGEIRNGEVVLNRVDDDGFRGFFQGRITGDGRMEGTGQNDPSSPGGNAVSYTWTAQRSG